jgi:hypothetical protein
MKRLPIGISDFKELIESDFYFIDKSLFIKEIIEDSAKIILLPRPRRFGKTLNLTMLRHFFENKEYKDKIKFLFKDFDIEKEKVFEKHLCNYPVIFLTFNDVKSLNFDDALESIKDIISDEFQRHSYLLNSDAISDIDKQKINDIMQLKASNISYEKSLKNLSHYLFKHHNQKVIVLIDEYDTPIHTAYTCGYYKEIIAFFRSFLGAGLKDNAFVFKGVLTGILRVAKESIFSGLNNLGVYTLLSHRYSDKFGITESEIDRVLSYYGLNEESKNISKWYNGYIFADSIVYNPWSIASYIVNIKDGYKPYWVNTSSNDIIKELVKDSSDNIKKELENLLKDKPLEKELDDNIVFEDLKKDEKSLYSFLVFCGYLKAFDRKRIGNRDYYKLLIPNIEVKRVFEDIIIKWFNESFETSKINEMLKALTKGDIEIFEEILNDFIIETLSYFDTGGKNVEKVYQAFILGLLVNLAPYYEVNSEKESGYGRYDICIVPKDISKKAIIMELKKIRLKETKEEALESALKQIEEKKYETEIKKRGIEKIIKMGVVFDGKRVWVKNI